MQVDDTGIEGLKLLTPRRFGDARGFFAEIWNARTFADLGIDANFVQDNHSLSDTPGTIRGLHFQAPPQAQAKLVRCGRGRLFDVAVDIRRGSPSYGQWFGVELSADNGRMLWIPEGFAHGFQTREPATEIVYKCTGFYAPEAEGTVRWDSCDIDWEQEGGPILSDKDAVGPPLSELTSPFIFEATA